MITSRLTYNIWTVETILGAEGTGTGTGTGEALSEGNQLTAGELMQVIDIKGDPRELQIPTGLPEETYVTIQRGDYPTADSRQGLLSRIAAFQLLLSYSTR